MIFTPCAFRKNIENKYKNNAIHIASNLPIPVFAFPFKWGVPRF
jgi:hypothetical protein